MLRGILSPPPSLCVVAGSGACDDQSENLLSSKMSPPPTYPVGLLGWNARLSPAWLCLSGDIPRSVTKRVRPIRAIRFGRPACLCHPKRRARRSKGEVAGSSSFGRRVGWSCRTKNQDSCQDEHVVIGGCVCVYM